MTASGVVTRAAGSRIDIELAPAVGCRGCRGVCMWRLRQRTETLSLEWPGDFAPGDRVVVALPERYVLHGSLLLYGVPLAALLGGAAAGAWWGGTDAAALAGALVAVVAALALVPRFGARLERRVVQRLEVRRGEPVEPDEASDPGERGEAD